MIPKLFKPEYNTKAEEFKKFLPVNVTLSFRSIAPAIALCERKYLIPLLGETLFERLVKFYNSSKPKKCAHLQELLTLCQFALIRLAFWQEYDILSVTLSDKGAADNAGENRLYRYQSEALKDNLKNEGFDQLDSILEFCEQNMAHFPEFAQSPCHIDSECSFIKNTKEFNSIYYINSSRLVFLKMKYFVTSVEELQLRHHLGDAFCSELLGADPADEKYSRVLSGIKKFVVFMAIAEGIAELHQMPTDRGLIFQTTIANRISEVQYSPVPPEELERIRKEYTKKAERYMNSVIDDLKRNQSDYPAYFTFAGNNAPPSKHIRRDNTNKKIFLA
jgi:hypothetical protein